MRKSSSGQKDISFVGTSVWNKLNNDLKILNPGYLFIHSYKKFLLKNLLDHNFNQNFFIFIMIFLLIIFIIIIIIDIIIIMIIIKIFIIKIIPAISDLEIFLFMGFLKKICIKHCIFFTKEYCQF